MNKMMCGLVKEVAAPAELVYHTDLPIPEINDDEVLIKVHCAAICGTDLHIMEWDEWSRKRMTPPVIPGHEIAGDIVAIGKNVKNRKIGDRISVETHIPCGKCYFCKHNMPHLCRDVKLFGCIPNSGFAEYTKIRSDMTFLLDDDISYEVACMFEPMGAGVHGVEAAEVKDKNVLISGCGPIGLTAISACKVFGAKQIFACDLLDEKLEIAKEMGADYVFNSRKCDLPEEIKKLTDGLGADACIDITGVGDAINMCLKCVRTAGRVVCVGLPTKPVTISMTEDVIFREVELTGISGRKIWETWEDFSKVMKSPYYKIEKVMGKRFAMKDFHKAIEEIKKGTPGKMLIYPDPKDMLG